MTERWLRMTKLSRSEIQTIEKYWTDYEDYKKQLKYREWELLNPHNEEALNFNAKSSKISNPTHNKAIILMNDVYYQNLNRIVKTVEDIYKELDDDLKTIVDMRYWDNENNCYEWQHIADELYMSVQRVLRKRNALIDMTAKRIGWMM